jgi:hypothetical protein
MAAQAQTEELSAHLCDLRAQAEAKLRCLTRLQQLVAQYEQSSETDRAVKHQQIVADLTDLVTISKSLRSVADEAFAAAAALK